MLAKTIQHAFNQANTDKSSTHGYHKHYGIIFKDFTPSSLLEIGVKRGESLAAWSMLFPQCILTGLDISDSAFKDTNISFSKANIYIGNSTEKETAERIKNHDVIIDDGSHYYKDILKTFFYFKNKFNNYYVIEDLMYKQEFVIKYIERLGFKVTVRYSDVKDVYVNKHWLKYNVRKYNEIIPINLNFLIIEKIT